MKLTAIILGALLLTGCSGQAFNYGVPVDCDAKYQIQTFPHGHYAVKIDRVKTDRFGNKWVHMVPNLNMKLYGRWQKDTLFVDYQCRGDNGGLRGTNL